jgi:drug/metabolite transporter (DMT)-like permease
LALAALFAGATAIATAPLFVRFSEAGPVATAFWRVFLALPALWIWALLSDGPGHWRSVRLHPGMLLLIGFFFAGDLAVWHWSILLTSVANATLLSNLAPLFVALGAWLLFSDPPRKLFLGGLAAALAGTGLLIGSGTGQSAVAHSGHALTRLRAQVATATLMAWSCLVMSALLLPVALLMGEQILPQTATGWITIIALALIAQAAGQSLIAYAMAHLPGTFSSVGLLWQPVAATLFAWVLIGETMGALQFVGAQLVLAGIALVRRSALLKK